MYHQQDISQLPVELITRIFILGAGYDYPYDSSPFLLKPDQEIYPAIPSSNFQLLVSHICTKWRAIAIRTSSLWTTIHFSTPPHILRGVEYLRRSGNRPIEILIDTVAPEEHLPGVTLSNEELDRIFLIIRPHVQRWGTFHLKVRDNSCKALARKYIGPDCPGAPHLRTLQLYHFEAFRAPEDLHLATYRPPVIIFSNDLPSLENVSLIGVNLNWAKSPYLKNLKHLELALHADRIRPPYNYFADMIRDSPQLETLCLHYSGPKATDGDPSNAWAPVTSTPDRVVLPSLRELTIHDLDPDYLYQIMLRLVFPECRKLALHLPNPEYTSDYQDFSDVVGLITQGLVLNPQPVLPLTSNTPNGNAAASIDVNTPPPPANDDADTLVPTEPNTDTPQAPPLHQRQTIHIRPFPSLSKLAHLIITTLECDVQTWRTLLRELDNLEILEVDFDKVSCSPRFAHDSSGDDGGGEVEVEGDESGTQREERGSKHNGSGGSVGVHGFLNLLMEGKMVETGSGEEGEDKDLEMECNDCLVWIMRRGGKGKERAYDVDGEFQCRLSSRSSARRPNPLAKSRHPTPSKIRSNEPRKRIRVPLLPKVRRMTIAGLSGEQIKAFIQYREGGWLECNKCASLDSSATHSTKIRHTTQRFSIEKYIVRCSQRVRGEDEVLDTLLERQHTVGERGQLLVQGRPEISKHSFTTPLYIPLLQGASSTCPTQPEKPLAVDTTPNGRCGDRHIRVEWLREDDDDEDFEGDDYEEGEEDAENEDMGTTADGDDIPDEDEDEGSGTIVPEAGGYPERDGMGVSKDVTVSEETGDASNEDYEGGDYEYESGTESEDYD